MSIHGEEKYSGSVENKNMKEELEGLGVVDNQKLMG